MYICVDVKCSGEVILLRRGLLCHSWPWHNKHTLKESPAPSFYVFSSGTTDFSFFFFLSLSQIHSPPAAGPLLLFFYYFLLKYFTKLKLRADRKRLAPASASERKLSPPPKHYWTDWTDIIYHCFFFPDDSCYSKMFGDEIIQIKWTLPVSVFGC